MRARREEYSEERVAAAAVVTFNVSLCPPSPQIASAAIGPLLIPPPPPAGGGARPAGIEPPTIVAVGLQRVTRYAKSEIGEELMEGWRGAVGRALADAYPASIFADLPEPGKPAYRPLLTKYSCGVLLLVWARADRWGWVSDARMAWHGIGLGGGRGTVALRMRLADSTVCLLCSHFEAETKEQIAQAAAETLAETRFGFTGGDRSDREAVAAVQLAGKAVGRGDVPADHDALIWFGDFHFSLDGQSPETIGAALADGGDGWARLLEADGLRLLAAEDPDGPFGGMMEGALVFPPTSYFVRGGPPPPPPLPSSRSTSGAAALRLRCCRPHTARRPAPVAGAAAGRYDLADPARLPGWRSRVLCSGPAVRGLRDYRAAPGGDSTHQGMMHRYKSAAGTPYTHR